MNSPDYQSALLFILISLIDTQASQSGHLKGERDDIDVLISDIKELYDIDIYHILDISNEKPKTPT